MKTVTITRTVYTLDELREHHPEAFRRVVDRQRQYEEVSGLLSDSIDGYLVDCLEDEGQPELEAREWDAFAGTVRLSGIMRVSEQEQSARVLLGLPALSTVRVSTGNRDYVGGAYEYRVEEQDMDVEWWETATDADEIEHELSMKRVRKELEQLERTLGDAVREYARALSSDEAIVEYLRNEQEMFGTLWLADGDEYTE